MQLTTEATPDRSRCRRPTPMVAAVLVAALAAASCQEAPLTEPDAGVPGFSSSSSELTFLRPQSDAPPLLTREVSFVATRGKKHRVELYYEDPSEPGTPGERFLRFELDEESLHRYPEDHPMAGAPFETGDTVTISIRAVEDTLLARFEPSGLEFNPDEPAELKIEYDYAELDPDRESDVEIWKQEDPDDPWSEQGGERNEADDSCSLDVTSFTRYALAL